MTFASSVALLSCGIAVYVAALSWQLSRAPGWQDQRYFSLAAVTGGLYAALNIPDERPDRVRRHRGVVLPPAARGRGAPLHRVAPLLDHPPRPAPLARRRRRRPGARGVAAISVLTPRSSPAACGSTPSRPSGSPTGRRTPRSRARSPTRSRSRAVRAGRAARRGVEAPRPERRRPAPRARRPPRDGGERPLVIEGVYAAPYLLDLGVPAPQRRGGIRAHRALRRGRAGPRGAPRASSSGRSRSARPSSGAPRGAPPRREARGARPVRGGRRPRGEQPRRRREREPPLPRRDGARRAATSAQDARARSRSSRCSGSAQSCGSSSTPGGSPPRPEARSHVAPRALADAAILGGAGPLREARPRDEPRTGGLWALAHEGVLAQVLVNLVVNAVQAIPDRRSDGRVSIRDRDRRRRSPRRRGQRQRDGAGGPAPRLRALLHDEAVRERHGARARGVARARHRPRRRPAPRERPRRGTRAASWTCFAARPTPAPARRGVRSLGGAAGPHPHRGRRGRRPPSFRRLLEPQLSGRVASGVDEGLSGLSSATFDLVLCDVMMPGGRGERLTGRSSAARRLARRVVFFTGVQ